MVGTINSIGVMGWLYPTDINSVGVLGWHLEGKEAIVDGDLPDVATIRTYRKKNIISGKPYLGQIPIRYIDPDARDLFFFDWSEDLEPADTIVSSTVIVETGATKLETELVENIVPAWLSDVALSSKILVICRIVTLTGRELDKSFYLVGREE